MLNSSDNHLDQQNRLQPLQQLINRHPIAFWTGLWAFLVLVGTVAAIGLIKPGPIEQPIIKEASKSTPTFTTIRQSQTKEDLSVSLLGTLTLGCAGVSLLVIQALKQSSQRRKNSTEFKQTPIKHTPTKIREQRGKLGKQRQIRDKRTFSSPVAETLPLIPSPRNEASPPAHKKRRSSAKKPRPVPRKPQTAAKQPVFETIVPTADQPIAQITVLPPEQNHSLDLTEEKLVDLMDLRKRRSLTSIMRGKVRGD
ncbi:MAG: hypothetical protein F6K58_18410 [Symploca sp. SIO2E9]|nr:hypothetical protein [Symploca sp. SIO2E9]